MKFSARLKLAVWLVLAVPLFLLTGVPILAIRQPPCPPQNSVSQAVPLNPPELQQLATTAVNGGGLAPTPEAEQEEREVLEAQIEQAKLWITDADEQQRLIGAEQFSAFPGPAAEQYLRTALAHDPADEVRAAAADSLAAFSALTPETLEVLVFALQDFSAEVQSRAFNTLQTLSNRANPDTVKAIRARLMQLIESGHLNYDNREAIKEFLQD